MRFEVGDVVAIPYRGVEHQGLVSASGDADAAMVVHASKRTRSVVEEPVSAFLAGRRARIVARAPNVEASVAFARSLVGERWTYTRNCQTFTRRVTGLPIRSRDADRVALASLAIACGAFLLRPVLA